MCACVCVYLFIASTRLNFCVFGLVLLYSYSLLLLLSCFSASPVFDSFAAAAPVFVLFIVSLSAFCFTFTSISPLF